ncbi:hypothetical protein [Streptomyces zaomyceticus]|uniref:DUF6197 family protein n=1 Tax=Streptomyces zaomyceticus TaxID=68286 RepID=UPI002E167274|nr:hypothetical protein OG237_42255 [Streptomyces zaomyceticus]
MPALITAELHAQPVARRAPAGPPLVTPAPRWPPRDPRVQPPPPAPPTWGQRLVPGTAQRLMAGLGLWQAPTPLPPSLHLLHTVGVLETYGWCKSLDVDPKGRLCMRGAQSLLEKTGHVTPAARHRAVDHMHTILAGADVHMPFYAWNDLPGRTFPHVAALLTRAAEHAHQIGD